MKKLVLLVVLFSLSTSFYVNAQSKKAQNDGFEATYQNMKAIINSQHYQYVGHVVYNSEDRKVLDQDLNQFEINSTSVKGALNSLSSFTYETKSSNSKITNYEVTFNDEKQTVLIEFNLDKDKFSIEVKPNGKAFLTLSSDVNNIRQTGMIKRI
ncbi:hypothetical protein [Winogradskyella undariae]|uniref:hypothetical protein n=1 Tax=Winogradskyella undariae TaxID=1285465 RepID=UPI0015CA4AB7|nr:hypothetical protein [Winogradskyella undariae]